MDAPHPPRSRRSRSGASARFLFVLLLLCLSACDTFAPDSPAAEKPKPKPEDRLQMVVERLERALIDFRPSGSEGLKTRSELTCEYVAPEGESSEPRAVVSIVTDTLYRAGVDAPVAGSEPEDEADEPDPDDAGPAGDLPSLPLTQKEKTEYELVFRQGAWQLDSKPEKRYVEIWFEYALATEIPLETE